MSKNQNNLPIYIKGLTKAALTSLAACVLFISGAYVSVYADDHQATTELSARQIQEFLQENIPNIQIIEITRVEEFGLYHVLTDDYTSIFVNSAGEDFIIGQHYSIDSQGKVQNESSKRRQAVQFAEVQKLPQDDWIIFSALDSDGNEIDSDNWVLVFTDIDCGYCRQFHREIEEVNRLGIEVRYAFFPRSGPDTPSFYKAESVWCSDNQQGAMTLAKAGAPLDEIKCDNPINAQMEQGIKLGVRGTPSMWTSNGRFIPGYQPPNRLLDIIQG